MSHRNYGSLISKWKRLRVYERDHFQCVYCGFRPKPSYVAGNLAPELWRSYLSIDHAIEVKDLKGLRPLIINSEDNLLTACRACNERRSRNRHIFYKRRYGRFLFGSWHESLKSDDELSAFTNSARIVVK